MRQDPQPAPETLGEIYRSPEYYRVSERTSIGYGDYYADEDIYLAYFRATMQALRRYKAPPGRYVEVGAAVGYGIEAAREEGWEASGFELSPDAISYARRRFGAAITEGGFEALGHHGAYDVIALFQVLEHVDDVGQALRTVRRALRPGGLLILTTPDHESITRKILRRHWPSYRPEHLWYFDRLRIRTILTSCSFDVLSIAGDRPLRVPVGRVIERATHYRGRRAPAWIARLGPRVPIWLGDMIVIARPGQTGSVPSPAAG